MIKFLLHLLLAFLALPLFCQQLPQYSLYQLNDVIINPALISSKEFNQFSLMARDQWSGFEGAPKTQSISYYNVAHHKYGRGIQLSNDVTGPISIIKGGVTASQFIPVQENDKLSVGASLNFHQYTFNNAQLVLENDGIFDPAVDSYGSDKSTGLSTNLGFAYHKNKLVLGTSILNLINSKLKISDVNKNKLVSHYYFSANYTLIENDQIKFNPGLLVKKIGASKIQYDLNTMIEFNKSFFSGLTFRNADAIIAMLGLHYNNYTFGYSYDLTMTELNVPSYGTHAVVLNYRFKPKPKDRDKDGIIDEKDDCPDVYGSLELNGCPDADNDKIIDKNDDCPFTFGLAELKGCPDSDSDGIADKYDDCPNNAGVAEFNGCPDTDDDGIQDDYDDCPELAGPIKNNGCPEETETDDISVVNSINWETISLWADRIHFEFDKYIIDENSKIILNKIAEFINRNFEKNLDIIGHTDEKGSKRYNQKLSEKRAKAVYDFLISKEVDPKRLKHYGVGESQNMSKNDNVNRRVEFRTIVFD
jgi:type IX secretion system PorP/SprF family membrane protein